MNKREFLSKLKEYLSYGLPESMVKNEIKFYSDYIDSEEAKGRSTDEIIADLGDPQLIAKSVIDAKTSGPDGVPGSDDDIDYSDEIYNREKRSSSSAWGSGSTDGSSRGSGAYGQTYSDNAETGRPGSRINNRWGGNVHTYQIGCLAGILILIAVVAVLGFIGVALAPFIVPIIMVFIIIWLFSRIGGGS